MTSQDVEFSQFAASNLYLNPALAGYKGGNVITTIYRNQWPDIPNSYNTQFISYDRKLQKHDAGIGGYIFSDVAGEGSLKRQNFVLVYSKQVRLSRKWYTSFGVKAGFSHNSINWGKLTWGDMIDAREGFVFSTNQPRKKPQSNYFDAGGGAILYSNKFYVGFAFEHINRPNDNLLALYAKNKVPVRYKVHLGNKFRLNPYPNHLPIFVSPQLIYTRQNKSEQFTYGANFSYKKYIAGLLFRQKESLIILLGTEMNQFRIGYSFDLGVTRLMNYSGGAHELSLSYRIEPSDKVNKKKYKTLSCPLF